jgi:Cytochrome c554 and c-prime
MDRKNLTLAAMMLSVGSCLAAVQQSSGARQAQGRTRAAAPKGVSIKSRAGYIGDEACRACHAQEAESYSHTAHHLTSRSPGQDSVSGSFAEGKNVLKTANPGLSFRMESKPNGFFQSAVWEIPPVTSVHTERIDVVIGSGRKGQTYLYWKGDRLFQLPVSYWVALESWVNSPGYRDGVADFDRPVVPRCLECHATYAEAIAGPPPSNQYKPASLVEGISCERCHGPGRAHVEAMTSSKAGAAASIVNPAKLTRDRQIDVCAQCHGGPGKSLAPVFSSIPGEPLDRYLQRDIPSAGATVDVHGNQIALLQRSRCYQSSADMSCSTCHNVHQPQRDASAFSVRCGNCHRAESCGLYQRIGAQIVGRCVDCHVPVQQSNLIVSDSNGRKVKATVRTHWIKVYPEAQNLREQ